MLAGRPHILFTATFHSSFIDEDIRILRKNYDVRVIVASGWKVPFLLLRNLFTANVTFSWFASLYSAFLVFVARLFGRTSIIVIGGADVAKEKELQYGIWNSWWKAPIIRYGITHATHVLAVDQFLKSEAMRLARYAGENIITIPTGYDPEYWRPSGDKAELVLTVASCPDMLRAKLKGIDKFISVAKKMPGIRFKILGVDPRIAAALDPPSNIECLPFSLRDEVRSSCQQAKVYCQLSYREGLPNALCEAMLCECIPIGTNVGGIPTAIGDTGFLVEYADEQRTIDAIREGLRRPSADGARARSRIASHFTLLQREEALKMLIDKLKQ